MSAGSVRGADTGALAREIGKLVEAPEIGGMRVGVRIERLAPERVLVYEVRGDEAFKPASNQKLITSAAALSLLPADFAYKTILAVRGRDLVIIGAGDPSTGDPRLAKAAGEPITAIFHRWAERLKAKGHAAIGGDLLFDDYIFEQEHRYPQWREQFTDSLQRWWAAPVGGLNFNDNCLDVVMKPASRPGDPPEVTVIPNTPWVTLKNTATTAAKGEPLVRLTGGGPYALSVKGAVSRPSDPDSPLSIAVDDPGMFFAVTCRTSLASKGVRIDGEARRQRVRHLDGTLPRPEEGFDIVDVYERKLTDFLWRVNKSSQNMFAEALFKTLGAYVGGDKEVRVGTAEGSRAIVKEFLQRLGVWTEGCVLDDGSGLSHDNRATPHMFTAVLVHMDSHARRREFVESLAEPGSTGTIEGRMKNLQGKVFAKTGHIGGVSSLSGYVLGPGGSRYAFSVLCNDTGKGKAGASHRLQDRICETLANWQPGGSAAGE